MPYVEAATHLGTLSRVERCPVLLALALLAALEVRASAQDVNPPNVALRPTQSLTLPQALEIAMTHNRNLQLARLSVSDAEQNRNIARAKYYPHIKNESTALHLTALEGVVIPAGAFARESSTGPIPAGTVRVGQGAQNSLTSGTGLSQPIAQLLRIHAGVRAATADVGIARLEASDAENLVALQVHRLYFDILTTQSKLTAADKAVQAGSLDEEETTRAVAQGRSLDVARLEAHAAFLEERQVSLTYQLAVDDLTTQLNDVLGLPLGTQLLLNADMPDRGSLFSCESDALEFARSHNPRVLAARQVVLKAKAGVTAAKDAYIPDVTGLARYSYQSGVPLLVHNFGTFGGAVSYEVFDGGAREARLKQARIVQKMAELRLIQTESDVSVQLSSTYDEIHKLEELITVAAEGLNARTETARVTQQRLEQNAALASEFAKANAGQAAAQASLTQARLDLSLLQSKMQVLLGQRPN